MAFKKASQNEENWPDLTKSRSEVRHLDYYLHDDKGEKDKRDWLRTIADPLQ